MTKKMSTPTKPPGSQARSAWKIDHPKHRERAQAVDVGSEIKRPRGARRDQVRRFEGFVQHAGSVGGRQSPTVRPRRRKSLGRDRQAGATSLAWPAAETILPSTRSDEGR